MAFHVRDPETDQLVRQLATKRGIGITDAVKVAVKNELREDDAEQKAAFYAKIRRLQDILKSYPSTGLEADKAFYDSLYE